MKFESQPNALAYLMGVYLSDGWLAGHGAFGLKVVDETFRDTTALAMKTVGAVCTLNDFQRPPRVHKLRGKVYIRRHTYQLYEKTPYRVGRWLERTFPTGKDHLPPIPDNLVRDLVAGIMDGDGSTSHRKDGYYHLAVCGYSEYLEDLELLFYVHDVKMHYHLGEMNHYINIKSFVTEGFYFRMPRKQAILDAYVVDSAQYIGTRGLKK